MSQADYIRRTGEIEHYFDLTALDAKTTDVKVDVMGTNGDYFNHYRYANSQPLVLAQGKAFDAVFDTVLGAEVAVKLGYKLGEQIELSHGAGAVSFSQHKDKPFTVVGILARTGTPVDQTVHVSLEAIEAIHLDWQQGAPMPGRQLTAEQALVQDLTPKSITAFMVGLKSRMATFTLQRQINEYKNEPLTAILPGVALAELWQMLGMVENLLLVISLLVLLAALVALAWAAVGLPLAWGVYRTALSVSMGRASSNTSSGWRKPSCTPARASASAARLLGAQAIWLTPSSVPSETTRSHSACQPPNRRTLAASSMTTASSATATRGVN